MSVPIDPNPEPNSTLEQAVTSAIETVENKQEPSAVEEPKVEEPKTEEPSTEVKPSDDQIAQAVNIYKLLTDPNTARGAVEFLAKQVGLQTTQEVPKQEQIKQTPANLEEVLKQNLKEYDFLAPGIARSLEQFINPLQETLLRTQTERVIDNAITKLNQRTQGDFDKHQDAISKLMDVVQPAKGVPYEQYLETLYNLATGTKITPGITKTVSKTVVDKINATAKTALPSPAAATEPKIVKGPALPNIAEAVAAAIKGERFG